MSEENKVTRRAFMQKTVVAGATVAAAGAIGSIASTPAMAAGIPRKWDKEVDVVVVGTGFAGLAAGITAKETGAKVIVIEKAKKEHEGGNSKVSGNMWWTPTNEQDGFTYVKALAMGTTDDESLRALEADHVKLNDWLSSKFGIKPAAIGGLFQPEHPELSGHECVRTWGNMGKWGNGEIYGPIRAYADKINLEFMYETPAKELVQSSKGEIIGIKAEKAGKQIFIKAKRGVVLGCGGFEFDPEMAKQFLPGWPVYGRGTPYNTGDGIKMCQKIGAQLWHMNNTLGGFGCLMVPEYAPILMNLQMKANGYIFLDKFCQRFMNEKRDNRHGFGHKEYQLFFDGILGEFTRNPWWTVFDDATAKKGPVTFRRGKTFTWFNAHSGYDWSDDNSAEVAKGWILKADDLAGLAAKMEVNPDVLIKSIDAYNEVCRSKVDSVFNRPAATLLPLEKGPFYAMKTYPATYNTQGGPKRNGKCQILNLDNQPIPRLYGGGEMGSFFGWMYNGGGNVAEALVTGQIAARNAVALKRWS
jgi:succinate dehydrogenase/fumarate reductase flavoprotein subunit